MDEKQGLIPIFPSPASRILTGVLSVLMALTSSPCLAAEREIPEARLRFFETRIRPLLVEQCQNCHGPLKARGDLRLDSSAGLQRGGASGKPLIDPQKPEQSLLLRAVSHRDNDLKMPPRGKLSERQIADLTEWVQMGGPFPSKTSSRSPETTPFWAFQPPKAPPIPVVKNPGWVQSPIDAFILSSLEAAGLRPAPVADRRTLIRRVTFDLIGLPPTPEEIDAFLKDTSPQAFARVVDRLLASPHYGERWGRHWLDVARYADSNGLDENVAFGNAWRYRDWVIQAFNADKSYDQFVVEQLAGDLLPSSDDTTRNNRIIATGFLTLGPKVLAEVDEKKMEMDIVDEQIDTLGRAFLGLTLGCARCHDHKFDPITMDDYYGLAGIFQSTRSMEHFKKVARWNEVSIASQREKTIRLDLENQLKTARETVAKSTEEALARVRAGLKPDQKPPANLETLLGSEDRSRLKQLREEVTRLEKIIPELPTAMAVGEAAVVETPIHLRGNHLTLGKKVPRHVPAILAGLNPPEFDSRHGGRLQLAQWLVSPGHPLTSRVLVNRLWRWHFGQGLVRSTDNFGKLGETPIHQPLQDYLACAFVESGWSIKAMHRLMVLSSCYQMSSRAETTALERDPDNRLHSHANLQRLEAEAIRDSLLVMGGLLDLAQGGSLLQVKNREYFFDHTSRDMTRYDSRRRSVYLPVVRNHLYDLFQLFDFPDSSVPNGNRDTTTVAPQALFLLNSDLVLQASEGFASRLLALEIENRDRIQLLYRRALGRDATGRDLERAGEILGQMDQILMPKNSDANKRRLQCWTFLCQIVLASNEFIYLR